MTFADPARRLAFEPPEPAAGGWWRPVEGRVSALLLAVMLAAVAFAIDGAGWAGTTATGESKTGFLPAIILLGGAWGLISAKSRLPALPAHVLGAFAGAAAVILAVAGVVSVDPDPAARLAALDRSLAVFLGDVLVRGVRSGETSAFLLAIGALAWASGQFAAFAVFRRHRPFGAVGVLGGVLVVELLVSARPQYPSLVIFSAAALLLLVRLNLLEQHAGWRRRGIADGATVSGLFARTGLGFVVLTVGGALLLTEAGHAAPLAGFWQGGVQDQLVAWGQTVDRYVGGIVGPVRGPQGLFSSSQTIRGFWEASGGVVFSARTSDGLGHYWRATTYDFFDGATWQQLDRTQSGPVAPGAALLDGTRDALATPSGRLPVTLNVTNVALGGDLVLAPDAPATADRAVSVVTDGAGGPLAALQFREAPTPGESYRLEALIRPTGTAAGALTQAELAAAAVQYPGWLARYVQVPGTLSGVARVTIDRIVSSLAPQARDPYHVAAAVQDYLYRTGGFSYNTNVQALCEGRGVVDCLLATKQGYCEYFATTMTMLLRLEQIPARYVMGYLPGRRLSDGSFEVDAGAAHAWVEVYFPGYGWVPFDPTPGNSANQQQPASFAPGVPLASPSPGATAPQPSFGADQGDPRQSALPAGGASATPPTDGSGGTSLALLVFALLVVGALGVAWRLRPGQTTAPPEADTVYRGVARLAGRFGYGPRPTQTAYEYAAALGDLLPAVRPELQLVARAKVQATYARRPVGGDTLLALRAAWRRLRLRLLGLAFRRRPRR